MNSPTPWMRPALALAAAYNLLWGAVMVFAPVHSLAWLGLDAPAYPEIWQCLGMVVGVYGIGYAIAAVDPYRHWPIILVGLIGKLAGPAGFLAAAASGELPWSMGWTILTNDLLWWLPFTLILLGAWRHHESALAHGDVSIVRTGDGWRLETMQVFHRPLEEVFAFFADAGNLERITPAHLNFEILTPTPIEMQSGARIDYRIRLLGVPMRWQTIIPAWEPPHRFVDEQVRGPYHRWVHEHRFEPAGAQVIVRDRVDYRPRGGRIPHLLFVAAQLKSIFRQRHEALADWFGEPVRTSPPRPSATGSGPAALTA